MEEKKFDLNSIIGFVLIGAVLMWLMYQNQPTPEEVEAEKAKQEQVVEGTENEVKSESTVENIDRVDVNDSLSIAKYKSTLGAFAYSATLPSSTEKTTTFENNVIRSEERRVGKE